MLQEGLETRHGVELPPREGARRLGTASKLWAGAGWQVGVRKLGELPGHPGPDGVGRKTGLPRGEGGYLKGSGGLTGESTNRTSMLDGCL